MLAAERRDLLMTRLRRDGKLVARDLAREFGLSEDSVRRDLRELAAAGLCQRVYGGAVPLSPALSTHASRSVIAPDSKQRVAARAVALISPGSTVILDSGTTSLAIAKALPLDLVATVVTNSATTAAALADHPSVDVFLLGGRLDKRSAATGGTVAAEAAYAVSADLCLLVAAGVHPKEGLTSGDSEEAAMKRILVSRAADTYAVESIEKIGTVARYSVVPLKDVSGIITDAPASNPVIQQFRDTGVDVIQAGPARP
jgi:DeoR/GlpR family transcriptional regulator of sugar metabolism